VEYLIAKWFAGLAWWMALMYNFVHEYDRNLASAILYSINYPYIMLIVLYLMNADRQNAKFLRKGDYTFSLTNFKPLLL